ncbi:MAG: ATP-binding protein, partial [Candidatus Omnitrophota bacterium]
LLAAIRAAKSVEELGGLDIHAVKNASLRRALLLFSGRRKIELVAALQKEYELLEDASPEVMEIARIRDAIDSAKKISDLGAIRINEESVGGGDLEYLQIMSAESIAARLVRLIMVIEETIKVGKTTNMFLAENIEEVLLPISMRISALTKEFFEGLDILEQRVKRIPILRIKSGVDSLREAMSADIRITRKNAEELDQRNLSLIKALADGNLIEPVEVDMSTFIKNMIDEGRRLMAEFPGLNIRYGLSAKPAKVLIPRNFMRMVDHLLKNAAQAGAKKISISMTQKQAMIRTKIVDDGKGLKAQELILIFAPFFSDRVYTGSFTLYRLEKALRLLSGSIQVSSEFMDKVVLALQEDAGNYTEKIKGLEFTLKLPLVEGRGKQRQGGARRSGSPVAITDAVLVYDKGKLLLSQGKFLEALAVFDEAKKLCGNISLGENEKVFLVDILADQGQCFAHMSRLDEALLVYEEALRIAPENYSKAQVSGLLANTLFLIAQGTASDIAPRAWACLNTALKALNAELNMRGITPEQILSVKSKQVEILLLRGYMYQYSGKDDKALDSFSQVLSIHPLAPAAKLGAHYHGGRSALRLGKYDVVRSYLEGSLERLSGLQRVHALIALSETYSYSEENIDKALELLREAVSCEQALPESVRLKEGHEGGYSPDILLGNIYLEIAKAYYLKKDNQETLRQAMLALSQLMPGRTAVSEESLEDFLATLQYVDFNASPELENMLARTILLLAGGYYNAGLYSRAAAAAGAVLLLTDSDIKRKGTAYRIIGDSLLSEAEDMKEREPGLSRRYASEARIAFLRAMNSGYFNASFYDNYLMSELLGGILVRSVKERFESGIFKAKRIDKSVYETFQAALEFIAANGGELDIEEARELRIFLKILTGSPYWKKSKARAQVEPLVSALGALADEMESRKSEQIEASYEER